MSVAPAYSAPWAKNEVWSRSSTWPPEASFMCARNAVAGSWVASRPARSADSSDLRLHSISAAMIIRMLRPPIGIALNSPLTLSSRSSRVL